MAVVQRQFPLKHTGWICVSHLRGTRPLSPEQGAILRRNRGPRYSEIRNTVSAGIMRIANGNFRVLHRVFTEIERLQKLNCLPLITPDLVEMARKGLLLGT